MTGSGRVLSQLYPFVPAYIKGTAPEHGGTVHTEHIMHEMTFCICSWGLSKNTYIVDWIGELVAFYNAKIRTYILDIWFTLCIISRHCDNAPILPPIFNFFATVLPPGS